MTRTSCIACFRVALLATGAACLVAVPLARAGVPASETASASASETASASASETASAPASETAPASASATAPAPASASATAPESANAVHVQVDGKTLVEGVVIDGTPYVEAGALAEAAGLRHEHDWRVDGTRLIVETTSRDRDAALQVRTAGIVSRGVRHVDGRPYVPADDVAHALGGHAHYDGKSRTLRVFVGTACGVCRLGVQTAVKSSL